MKEKKIPPGTVDRHIITDPETGKEIEVETIAAIDLNPGDLDEIIDEIKKIMYENLAKYPKLRKKPPIHAYFKAIREMYRKKHPRLVQYMDMLKDNEKVDIHTATEEQILKIGKTEKGTPISLNFFTQKIGEDIHEFAKELAYRINKKGLSKYKIEERKRFEGKERER